jgi:hypothetical protein
LAAVFVSLGLECHLLTAGMKQGKSTVLNLCACVCVCCTSILPTEGTILIHTPWWLIYICRVVTITYMCVCVVSKSIENEQSDSLWKKPLVDYSNKIIIGYRHAPAGPGPPNASLATEWIMKQTKSSLAGFGKLHGTTVARRSTVPK